MKQKFLLSNFLLFSLVYNYAQERKEFIYAKMETENAQFLKNEFPDSIQIISSKDNLSAIYFHPSIAESLHHKFSHGHGYLYQATKDEAINFSNPIKSSKGKSYNYTISENDFINTVLGDVDEKEIEKNILLLENFKTRYHLNPKANEAVLKMKEVWEKIISQYKRNDISVQIVDHINTPMKSLILRIDGNEYKDEHIIIGGHLDSTIGWNQNQIFAPGADDNASGIATITEILRVLLQNNFKPQRTVEIMAYAGEEEGLIGSEEIAKKYAFDKKDVIGYLQFDMTNYKGSSKDIYLFTDDYCDANLTNFLKELMDNYNQSGEHRLTYDTSVCGYGCSDHASWAYNGYAVAFPFETSFEDINPNIHTTNDTYKNLGNNSSHAAKFVKLGIEYVVEAAKQTRTLNVEEIKVMKNDIYFIDNILHYKFEASDFPISFYITDASGKKIKAENRKTANGTVELSHLAKGFYIAVFKVGNGKTISHKFVIK